MKNQELVPTFGVFHGYLLNESKGTPAKGPKQQVSTPFAAVSAAKSSNFQVIEPEDQVALGKIRGFAWGTKLTGL